MKSTLAWFIFTLAFGITSSGFGQDHALNLPQNTGDNQKTGLGSTSKNTSGASAEATPNPEDNTAEEDDSLYRGKTSDMENTLMRDEGALHFKSRKKEKIQQVDSLKSLQSSGTDPKFQGSFAISGVSSIEKIAEKAAPAEEAAPQIEDQGDPRFVRRHLKFTPQQNDKPAKSEAESSPSPTPSPSSSPEKKKSSDSKE